MASLDEVLAKLSRTTIAALALTGGVLFIVISDPPHTLCDSQLKSFQQKQQGFLLLDPQNKGETTPLFARLVAQCKISNSPGGCYELFSQMRMMLEESKTVSLECAESLGDLALFKNSVLGVAGLLMKFAWGEKPPASYFEKFGWLDNADVSLFCTLKQRALNTMDGPEWNQFVEQTMMANPGAAQLTREKVWGLSLASVNCGEYL